MDYDALTIIETNEKSNEEIIRKYSDYGFLYGGEEKLLTREHLEALLNGNTLATGINDEYVLFIRVKDGELDALKEIS